MRLIVILLVACSALIAAAGLAGSARTRRSAPAPPDAAAGTPAPQRIGSMSELMVDIIYPMSDAIFYVTTREPTNDVEWNALRGKTADPRRVGESADDAWDAPAIEDRWMADAKLLPRRGHGSVSAPLAGKDLEGARGSKRSAVSSRATTCHMHYRANYGRRPAPEPPR